MVADQTIRDADANAQGSTTMADLMAGLPPLLLGTYTPKIDAKGRMALPAKFRSQLGQGLVMARGQERCVYLLPFDDVVIGVGTRAELWNKDTWESYLAEKEEGYSDIADDVLPEVEF